MTGSGSDLKQSEEEGGAVKKRSVRRRALKENGSRTVVQEGEFLTKMKKLSYSPEWRVVIF
jgi:hypothetical protein